MKLRKRRRVLQAVAAAAGSSLLGLPAWSQTPGRLLRAPRRALVIGNSKYGIGALRNPANDAGALAEQLRTQRFEVVLGVDLKRDEMAQLIGAYGDALAREKPVAVFYFAGHAVQLAWRNYLVPVDANVKSPADVQAQCIDLNSLIDRLRKAANPMNVIILDACRDNPFDSPVEQKGLSQLDAPAGTLIAYATSPGNVAIDGDGANALYTEHLLREMKVPDTKIEDVFKRVRLGVRRRSNGRQIPWESTSLEEDFWFTPPRELKQLAEDEAERTFLEEAAAWEKADGSASPSPLEEYLRRYPSGRFAELAQLQLDAVLARQGEKPIRIASSAGNPFTQGHARADPGYKVGDSYTYVRLDRDSRQVLGRARQSVTELTEREVIFDHGRLVLDRLGNAVKLPDGRRFTPRQDQPLEYALGKKWSTRFRTTGAQGPGAESEFDFRITRRETISVPAGSFDCFVIEGQGYSYTDRGLKIQLGLTRWIAPDKVRRPIVSEQFRKVEGTVGGWGRARKAGQFLNNERLELVAFSQS
ncbi:MAG TPA: caspase family protein [Burkholderiales bacterium]|nr:caspase family protein [Burkholderiales bacterium]